MRLLELGSATAFVAGLALGCGTRSSEAVASDAGGTVDATPANRFRVDAGAPGWNADTPLPEAQYAEQHAAELCAAWGACCGAIGETISTEKCMAGTLAAVREMTAFRKAQGGVYDPVAAGRCVAAVRGAIALCTIERLDPAMSEVDKWCEKVIPGMGNEGDPCHGPGDCKEIPGKLARCLTASPTNVCRYFTRSEIGEPCGAAIERQCVDSAYCDRECKPILREGEACISPNDAQCATDNCVDDRCQPIVLFTAKNCASLR